VDTVKKKLPILVVLVFLIGIMATTVFAYPTNDGSQANYNNDQWSCTSLAVAPPATPVEAVVDQPADPVTQTTVTDEANAPQGAVNQAIGSYCWCEGNPASCVCDNTRQMNCDQCPQYMKHGSYNNNCDRMQASNHNQHRNGHHR
jgi:hypothetical protein